MNAIHRRILLLSLKLGDLLVATIAYGLASYLLVLTGKTQSFSGFLSMRIKLANFLEFGMVLLAWHLVYLWSGLYESKRLASSREIVSDELKATALSAIALLIAGVTFKIRMITLPFLILFWCANAFGLVAGRALLRYGLRRVRRRGHNLRNVLIVGTNSRALEVANRLLAEPEWGYRILGFVDEPWPGVANMPNSALRVVADTHGLADYLRRNVVDEVAIYLPLRSFHAKASRIAHLCKQHGITVRYDTDVLGVNRASTSRRQFDSDPYSIGSAGTQYGWALVFKRLFDLLSSAALLLLLGPLLAVTALFVRLSSPGPIFFRQERIGVNKRRFYIWKFRTMVVDAESLMPHLEAQNEVSGPVFKMKNDPRITPIGKWLRRTSVDELPQLFNVLRGEMSLVGPRPLPVRDFEGFSEDWQRRRFSVRPGITCLWQVQGRSEIGFDRWMELDIEYLDQWSLWLDLKILAMTIPAVMKGSGAA
jgi:exopolysaccharide biosynthesis polyprenyl glycosylphosphotransferase